jgi:hypothetical protein
VSFPEEEGEEDEKERSSYGVQEDEDEVVRSTQRRRRRQVEREREREREREDGGVSIWGRVGLGFVKGQEMRSVSQEEPRDKEGSMSGRDGGGVGTSSSSLAAGAAATAAVTGSPHHIRRDGSGIAPGIARLAMAQRQRQQQRKHPEPLRRAVADCLSATHHASTPMFPSEAVRTIQV